MKRRTARLMLALAATLTASPVAAGELHTANVSLARTWGAGGLDASIYADGHVFAQTATYNGSDPGNIRIQNAQLMFQESVDDGYHATEVADVLGLVGDPADLGLPAEVGSVTASWSNDGSVYANLVPVAFTRAYTDPVVIAQVGTTNGAQQVAVSVLLSGAGDQAAFSIFEPSTRDGAHVAETVHYLVIEAGEHRLPDGRLLVAANAEVNSNLTGAPSVAIPAVADAGLLVDGSAVIASAIGFSTYNGVRLRKAEGDAGTLEVMVRHMREYGSEVAGGTAAGTISVVAIGETSSIPAAAGDLRITEVMVDSSLGDAGQWIELYNTTEHTLTLDGLGLDFGVETEPLSVDAPYTLPAKTYMIVAASDDRDANGNVKVDLTHPTLALTAGATLTLTQDGETIDSFAIPAGGDTDWSWALDRQTLMAGEPDAWCQEEVRFDGAASAHASPRSANRACAPDAIAEIDAPTAADGTFDGSCVTLTSRPAYGLFTLNTVAGVPTALAAYDNDTCAGDPAALVADESGVGYIELRYSDGPQLEDDGAAKIQPWEYSQFRSYRVLPNQTVFIEITETAQTFQEGETILQNDLSRVHVSATGHLVLTHDHPLIGAERADVIAGPYDAYELQDRRLYGVTDHGNSTISRTVLLGGSDSPYGDSRLELNGHGRFYQPTPLWNHYMDGHTLWDLAKRGGLAPITIDYVDLDGDADPEMIAVISNEDGTGTLVDDPLYIARLAEEADLLSLATRVDFFGALSVTQQEAVGDYSALLQDADYMAIGYTINSTLEESGLELYADDCGEDAVSGTRFVLANVCYELEDGYVGVNLSVGLVTTQTTFELGGANVEFNTSIGEATAVAYVGEGGAAVSVGASALSTGGSVTSDTGSEVGASVGIGLGFSGGAEWGDRVGFTMDIKLVSISLYVSQEDAETMADVFWELAVWLFDADGLAADFSSYLFESCFWNPTFCEMGQ